ncbi:MAG TPA: PDZ domain-containing protein [Clostridiales bacterium]|nr:PDZ domain-containing protein [Clostridiales bacterium]
MNDNENRKNFEISGFDSYSSDNEPPAAGENGHIFKEQDFNDTQAYETNGTQPDTPQGGMPPGDSFKQESSFTPHSHYGFFPSGNYGIGNTPPPPYTQPYYFKQKVNKKLKEKRYGFRAIVASVIIASILGAAVGTGTYMAVGNFYGNTQGNNTGTASEQTNIVKTINITSNVESVVQAVAEKAGPSVVGIRTTAAITGFFGGTTESTGEGSGIIYTKDGYIITNYHVIQEAAEQTGRTTKIEVFLPSDPENAIEASIVGYNISSDLAVIKINKTGLPAIEIGNSDELKVGEYVVAIGNPGGLEFMGSVSYGIISGLNRRLNAESMGSLQLIQTDAAINPGNSGGALVNTKGQLIGVNSVKLVAEEFEGMGFAIPVNTVVQICDEIIKNENEPTPYIGVSISTRYDAATLQMLGYPPGAVVQSVVPNGPADRCGIKRGDIITEFNGQQITGYASLNSAINACKPGDTVTVKVYRSGKIYSASLTVGANNENR